MAAVSHSSFFAGCGWRGLVCLVEVSAIALCGCSSREVCGEGYLLVRGACVEEATEESRALALDKAIPADGAEDASRSDAILLKFSAPLDASTVDAGSVTLVRKADGERVPVELAVNGAELRLTPQEPLALYAEHVVEVRQEVGSEDGVQLTESVQVAWRTRDGRWSEPAAVDEARAYEFVAADVDDQGNAMLLMAADASKELWVAHRSKSDADWKVERLPNSPTATDVSALDVALGPGEVAWLSYDVFGPEGEVLHVVRYDFRAEAWAELPAVTSQRSTQWVDLTPLASGDLLVHWIGETDEWSVDILLTSVYRRAYRSTSDEWDPTRMVESYDANASGRIHFVPLADGSGQLSYGLGDSIRLALLSAEGDLVSEWAPSEDEELWLHQAAVGFGDGRTLSLVYGTSTCFACFVEQDPGAGYSNARALPLNYRGASNLDIQLLVAEHPLITLQERYWSEARVELSASFLQDGAWTDPEPIGASAAHPLYGLVHVSVADPRGNLLVVWEGATENGEQSQFLHVRRRDGEPWTRESLLFAAAYPPIDSFADRGAPYLGVKGDGSALFVWYDVSAKVFRFSDFK